MVVALVCAEQILDLHVGRVCCRSRFWRAAMPQPACPIGRVFFTLFFLYGRHYKLSRAKKKSVGLHTKRRGQGTARVAFQAGPRFRSLPKKCMMVKVCFDIQASLWHGLHI